MFDARDSDLMSVGRSLHCVALVHLSISNNNPFWRVKAVLSFLLPPKSMLFYLIICLHSPCLTVRDFDVAVYGVSDLVRIGRKAWQSL